MGCVFILQVQCNLEDSIVVMLKFLSSSVKKNTMLNKILLVIEREISRKYRVAFVFWTINVHQESQLFMQRTEVLLE